MTSRWNILTVVETEWRRTVCRVTVHTLVNVHVTSWSGKPCLQTLTLERPYRVYALSAIPTAVFHPRTLIYVFGAFVTAESSSRTVAGKTPRAYLTVWTAAKALRSLADFVVVGAGLHYIRARADACVVADGAVAAGRAGARVQGRFTTMTSETTNTAALERAEEVIACAIVEARRGGTIVNIRLTVPTYTR